MAKLLTIISLILVLVLFPPAALAVISNNAIPGDATYPIKRSLEDIIFTFASLNPTTKAWFAAARSDRRFKELKTLVAQGKKSSETLNELVEQTEVAASQLAQVINPTERAKLIDELSQSIEKYDQGLQQFSTPSNITTITTSLPPTTPQPTTTTVIPTPAGTDFISPSAPTTQPTIRPTSTPQSTPAPHRDDEDDRQKELEEARRRLEEIRRRLEQQAQRTNLQQSEDNNENSNSGKREAKEKEEKIEKKEEKEKKENDHRGKDSDLTPKDDADKIKKEKR